MLKELVARFFLVLFIIGLASEAAPEDASSTTAKQSRLGPSSKTTSTPSETAS